MEVLASLAVERASPGYLLAEARIQMKNEGWIMEVLASLAVERASPGYLLAEARIQMKDE
jgi:hypothetical protein